jgi:hypothetical protein
MVVAPETAFAVSVVYSFTTVLVETVGAPFFPR